jgi:2-polyprenyl-3-methyl-5-hydroxy-6-metoxy-1,4-benzoquinol methylase
MNNVIIKIIALVCLPTAIIFTSCSTARVPVEIMAIETPDGAIIVETTTMTATVTAIDPAKRKLKLVSPGGSKSTYKAGPEIVNFDQIQVGDHIKAMVTEEVAVFIGSGASPSAMTETTVMIAPAGANPGSVLVDTSQITVKVINVNAAKHKVTFELPDGTTKTVKIGKKVDLSTVRAGDNVTVQVSEGFAITVEKKDSPASNGGLTM